MPLHAAGQRLHHASQLPHDRLKCHLVGSPISPFIAHNHSVNLHNLATIHHMCRVSPSATIYDLGCSQRRAIVACLGRLQGGASVCQALAHAPEERPHKQLSCIMHTSTPLVKHSLHLDVMKLS